MKNYLVVGGNSGIGKAIAQELAVQGHQIIVISKTAASSVQTENIKYYNCDITEETPTFPEDIEKLDGIIYCPGTINLRPFKALKQSEFMHDLQVNYLGAIKTIQRYIPQLLLGSDPNILLFSTVAVKKGMPFHTSIAGAKGAVEGLTISLAAEYAPKLRVNAIAPSLTQTPLSEKLLNSEAKIISAGERHPLKRIGQTTDIVNAALYLLNASWVTGQIMPVEGGMLAIG
jgi:NAD(P)-dependent dehydrogenase (short-subunit alcohol dehydrogenase family)